MAQIVHFINIRLEVGEWKDIFFSFTRGEEQHVANHFDAQPPIRLTCWLLHIIVTVVMLSKSAKSDVEKKGCGI